MCLDFIGQLIHEAVFVRNFRAINWATTEARNYGREKIEIKRKIGEEARETKGETEGERRRAEMDGRALVNRILNLAAGARAKDSTFEGSSQLVNWSCPPLEKAVRELPQAV